MGRSSPSEDLRIFCDLLLVKAIEGFESPSQIFFFKVRVITVSQVGHVSAEMSSRFGPSSPPHSRYSLHSLSMSDWMHTQPAGKKGDSLPSRAGARGGSRKRNRSRQAPLPLGAPRTNASLTRATARIKLGFVPGEAGAGCERRLRYIMACTQKEVKK